jgi:hypothetical protein
MAGMTYDQTYPVRDVSAWLATLQIENPTFFSLLKMGTYRDGPSGVAKNRKLEWYDRALTAPKGTIDTEAASGQADVILGTGEGANFTAGDVVSFKGPYPEFGKVDSVATDTLTLTANLTYTHVVGVEVLNVSRPVAEGDYAPRTGYTSGTARYNYAQTFARTYGEAAEAQAQDIEDAPMKSLAVMAEEKMQEIYREMNAAALMGIRGSAEADGTLSSAGGILWWIMQNSDSNFKINAAAASLSSTLLNNAIQVTGGRATAMIMHSDQQRMLSKINSSEANKWIIINQNSSDAGVEASARFLTDVPAYGTKIAIVDDNMPKQQILMANMNKCFVTPLRNCALRDEPKKGSTLRGAERAIWGTYTFQFQDVFTDFALIYNLAAFS